MNKRFTYIILIVFFVAALAFIFLRYQYKKSKNEIVFYELQERKGALAAAPEWAAIRSEAETLSKAVRLNPDDKKSALGLAALFIQEARVTGNYSYYDMAALKEVNDVLKKEPNNFQALTFKAIIYLSQHHFADGLTVATQAQKINPYNGFIYCILVDANVELGDYKTAIAMADKMISIRPDIRSYARISYIREIFGDYPGAVEAMQMAVEAGVDGDESTEWSRIQLGHLYESMGDIKNADLQYNIALNERPDYPYAIAGLARIAASQKNVAQAITYYQQALALVNDYGFKEELIDLYQQLGNTKKADSLSYATIDELQKNANAANSDENIGHYADKELAYAYLKVNKVGKALEHALAEYNRRPKNIDVNETVAWVFYNKGDYEKAIPYIQEALKTKSKNPVLLCHAGLMYHKAGDYQKAKSLLQEGLKNNPNIPASLKNESARTLQSL